MIRYDKIRSGKIRYDKITWNKKKQDQMRTSAELRKNSENVLASRKIKINYKVREKCNKCNKCVSWKKESRDRTKKSRKSIYLVRLYSHIFVYP